MGLTSWFVAIGVVLGTFLVFAIPPFQGIDEPNHFLRVSTVVDGVVLPPTVHAGTTTVDIGGRRATVPPAVIRPHLQAKGVVVTSCLIDYIARNYDQAASAGPFSTATFYSTPPHCARAPNVFVIFDNTAINSPISYLPEVVGVGALRAVGAPLPTVFYGGRLIGLLAYVGVVALALRWATRGRGVLFVVGLMPMSLEGASTYSADGFTLALTLLVVALTIRCIDREDADWRWVAGLAASCWLLALCKDPYVLLSLLVLLVPTSRLRRLARWDLSRSGAVAVKVGIVAVAFGLAGIWYWIAVRGVTLQADYPPSQVNQAVQTTFMLHHPWGFLKLMGRSILFSSSEGAVVSGMVSSLGFARNQVSSEYPPVALIVFAGVVLFAAFRAEVGARVGTMTLRRRAAALVPLGIAVAGGLAVYAAAALRSTAPGSLLVSGVQGRYLDPLLSVPMVSIVLLRRPPARLRVERWLVAAMALLALYTVLKVFVRFY